jgi:phosphatidylglycerol---prolipoprotein diacylglyceryl transferase
MAALIPYITLPEVPLSFLRYVPLLRDAIDPNHPPSIKPFGALVALGVYFGTVVATRRAKARGYDGRTYNDFVLWTVGMGFVLGHVLDALFYHPDTVLADPLYLLKLWDGLSSYGGLIGAVVGAVAWGLHRRRKVLELVDITVSAFPVGWAFGRAGCSVVHDHPGIQSSAWYAVRFPAPGGGVIGRIDLGLMEFAFTVPFAIVCALLWWRNPRRPTGFWIALACTVYAPVRFLLDFLRLSPSEAGGAGDARYDSLTPAQWACFLMLGTGLYFLWRTKRQLAPVSAASPRSEAAVPAARDTGAGRHGRPRPT